MLVNIYKTHARTHTKFCTATSTSK